MDLSSLPPTALALVWAFLGNNWTSRRKDCQAFRGSCRAAALVADGLIQRLDLRDAMPGLPARAMISSGPCRWVENGKGRLLYLEGVVLIPPRRLD